MLAAVVAGFVFGACGGREASVPASGSGSATAAPPDDEPSPHDRELVALWEHEKKRRAEIDFATHPPSDGALGADPYRIVRAGKHLFGLLRGDSAIVVLDASANELARAPTPRSPSGLAVLPDGDVLVVGEGAREIAQYRFDADKLERVATLAVDALGMRGIALSPDGKTAYVVEERQGRLLAVALGRDGRGLKATSVREVSRCHGPIGVATLDDVVATNCLLDRAIEIRRGTTLQRIQHDGPMWSFALHRDKAGSVLVAAGGVEDHPLERADGGFNYVDSYVFLYRVGKVAPVRLAAVNTSEHGGITPKWLEMFEDGPDLRIEVSSYGGGESITIGWADRKFDAEPGVMALAVPPGTSAFARVEGMDTVAANSLLDAWVVGHGTRVKIVPAGKSPSRKLTSRVGELLFFTEMMAPWGKTDGKLSRFTCETCHHEGYTDGRTHFTGREEGGKKVHATTRPLLGLFNNAPYFSRALDQTMTQMVHSEFKVANRHNGRDPWFALASSDLRWWKHVDGLPQQLSAEQLREAFTDFLIDFSHRRNPAADHTKFTALERRGAEAFRDRCASCHAARLIAEEPTSAVAYDRWEQLVLSSAGPLVWNTAAYAKTGIEPYVHEEGARIPSLRRLYKKWPYFTNGSAKSLAEVLDRFAWNATTGMHDQPTKDMTKLSADDKAALLAFLDLL